MSKKKKKPLKRRKPPLSLLDKMIYGAWFLLLFCVFFGVILFVTVRLPRTVAFSDSQTVAFTARWTAVLFAPSDIYIALTGFLVGVFTYMDQTPIFGNRKIQYGTDPWDFKCYPLVDRRHWKKPSKKDRKGGWRIAACLLGLWLAGLLLVALLAIPAVFGRNCLQNDGSVVSYNGWNQQIATHSPETLTVRAYYHTRSRSLFGSWRCALVLRDGTHKFTFDSAEFRRTGSQKDWLEQMLEVKSHVPLEDILIDGGENLMGLQRDYGFDGEEMKLLRELFSH